MITFLDSSQSLSSAVEHSTRSRDIYAANSARNSVSRLFFSVLQDLTHDNLFVGRSESVLELLLRRASKDALRALVGKEHRECWRTRALGKLGKTDGVKCPQSTTSTSGI